MERTGNPDDDAANFKLALDYFQNITLSKYDFRTIDEERFVPALRCENAQSECLLAYPEFTAVYPNGSVVASRSGSCNVPGLLSSPP